jgi:hypothetical protein
MRARAFTLGNDIHFAPQQLDLHRPEGRLRLAHEVVHTVQQRGGPSGGGTASTQVAEHEAWQGANSALAGRSFRVRQRVARQIQRDDNDTPEIRPFSPRPEFQLRLDPEIEAMMLRMHIRRWMAGLWATGSPPTDTSTQTDAGTDAGTGTQNETETPSVPSPDAAAGAGTASQPGPRSERSTPPDWLRPPPGGDTQSPSPSVGALLAPFNARQVPADARDVNEVLAIYRRNYRFVSFLPDLRSAVPGFIRPLIPTDWRKGLAESFTAATVDTQLQPHFPTQSEITEQFIFHVTGVKTHWLPSITLSRF